MDTIESYFAPRKIFFWLTLLVVFGLGLAIRLYDLTDAPLDFHATRQLHSVLKARGMYYQNLESVPDWQRQMAVQQWQAEALIEPQILERLTATTYQVVGGEYLFIPRLYSILFWMLGGVALFALARDLAGVDGAVIALIYYLILPYAALASRAFQPDPLMTMMIILALWAANRWRRTPTWGWTVAAGLLGGLAILVKAVAVFFIAGAFTGLVLAGRGLRAALRDRKVWLMAALAIIPYAIYHYYGVYVVGRLGSQFNLRFFPNLWLDPVWYLRWNGELSSVAGFEWYLISLLGCFLARRPEQRALLLGAWAGYLVYGFTLPHHIATHDYYHLPLVPIVALGLAGAVELVLRSLRGPKILLYAAVIGVTLFAMTIKAWDVRVALKRMDYRSEVVFWQKLGERLGAGASAIGLTQDYGYRLAYWGWVNARNWMYAADFSYRELAGQTFDSSGIEEMFYETIEGKDYFVVTVFDELERQPVLKRLLYDNYPILDESDDYVIFDLRHPPQPKPAAP